MVTSPMLGMTTPVMVLVPVMVPVVVRVVTPSTSVVTLEVIVPTAVWVSVPVKIGELAAVPLTEN